MGAVNEPRGTGYASALKQVKVAGKTGTAQVVRMAADFKKGDMNRMPSNFETMHGLLPTPLLKIPGSPLPFLLNMGVMAVPPPLPSPER